MKCKVECKCGWTEVFSSGYSGVIIECPKCGKTHLIPVFDAEHLDESIDMSTMNRLLDEQQEPAETPHVTVPFPRLLLLAGVIAVVVAILALALIRPLVPNAAAVAGGALSWPMGISVAWLGQALRVRKISRA